MNRVPVTQKEFVRNDTFDRVYNWMFNPQKSYDYKSLPAVAILTGPSGVGKTETALQLYDYLYKKDTEGTLAHCIEACFSSFSASALLSDIFTFAKDRQLDIQSLDESQDRDLDNIGKVIMELYETLEQKYPTHLKCLTFDDAELCTSIVKHIDIQICQRLAKEPEAYKPSLWKIIVTTRNPTDGVWLQGCKLLNQNNFFDIKPFTLIEARTYLSSIKSIQTAQRDHLHDVLKGLPLALKVVREYLAANKLISGSDCLDGFFRSMSAIEAPSIISAIHLSMKRLLDSLPHTDLARTLLKMISLLNEKNITMEMLVSMAEVALSPVYSSQMIDTSAERFSSQVLAGLDRRHLCEIPDGRGSFSFHKLVQESTELFSKNDSDQERVSVLRMCLVAMTRVAPKDGRGHQSHKIYSYMFRHAESICKQVSHLKERGVINRRETPSILLLHADLLASMAYFQLALRNPITEAKPFLKTALDSFSEALLDCKYEQIGSNLMSSSDSEKAEILLEASKDGSNMCYSRDYQKLAVELSQFRCLTKKDLLIMIDFEDVRSVGDYLENGHLNGLYYQQLSERGMILSSDVMSKTYIIELLVELYFVTVRTPNFVSGDVDKSDALENALSCGQAALMLCKHTRDAHQVSLMAEVIIERLILAVELKLENRTVTDIMKNYQVLSQIGEDKMRRYGYEYGIRRTDFLNDDYHQLVCMEDKATCYGILHRQCDKASGEAEKYFRDGSALFLQLLEKAKKFKNFQTIAKTYKKYAVFLKTCDDYDEAIRCLIDAMIHLNLFLREISPSDRFPEQRNVGRFKALYDDLKDYYTIWSEINFERSTDTMLQVTVEDDVPRINYLVEFNEHLKTDEFPVLVDLIPVQQEHKALKSKADERKIAASIVISEENEQATTSTGGQSAVQQSFPVQATD